MNALSVSLTVLSAALLLADDASACGKHRGRRGQAAGSCGGATTMVVADCSQATVAMPATGDCANGMAMQAAPQVQYQVMAAGAGCGQESARRGLFGRRHR